MYWWGQWQTWRARWRTFLATWMWLKHARRKWRQPLSACTPLILTRTWLRKSVDGWQREWQLPAIAEEGSTSEDVDQPAPRRKRKHIKSGMDRTGAIPVVNKVTWPHQVVYTSARKPASYQIYVPHFVWCPSVSRCLHIWRSWCQMYSSIAGSVLWPSMGSG